MLTDNGTSYNLVSLQILWENRFAYNNGSRALTSVDGTDCPIWEPSPFSNRWWSWKLNGAGLRYEVAICIQSGMIVWVNGPFPPAYWTDLNIFRFGLMFALQVGEWVVGDKGYRDGMNFIIPKGFGPEWYRNMVAMATARHENVNCRLKRFGILCQRYPQDINQHEETFLAIAINFEMELGYEPMDVHYDDTQLDLDQTVF